MEDLLAQAASGVVVCDEEWVVTHASTPVTRLLGDATDAAPDEVEGRDLGRVLPANLADRLSARLAEDDGPVTVEEYLPTSKRWVELRALRGEAGTLVEVRDVTRWVQQVNELEAERENRKLLNRLVELVSELLGAVVTATTAEEIQAAVVSQLAAADLFELAWVGDWAADRDGLAVRATDGAEDVLDAIRAADQDSPERRALDAGETVVVRRLAEDETVPERIRKAVFASGIQAGVAVPLTYGETTFGVLGLYTARPEILDDPGLAGIEMLGEVIGFVLHATRQRQAMDTSTQRELVFDLGPTAGPLARLASEFDADCTLEGTANIGTEVVLAYVSVTGADVEAFCAAATEDPAVERARAIEETDDGGVCEMRLGGDSPLVGLVALGATIRSATVTADGGQVTADVAPQTDVRGLLDDLTQSVDDVGLRATHTRERPAKTTAAVEEVLGEELTERQRTALQTAFEAGYFASPRHSTAAEVAESLDVSSPTFSHHLRVAQRKLLTACFD